MSSGRRLPSSLMAPSPTATTLPFCGFSLAVSGRTMPLAVVSSSSTGLTISLSPRGFSFIREPPLSVSVCCESRESPLWSQICGLAAVGTLRVGVPTEGKIAMWGRRSSAGGRETSVRCQQTAAEELGDALAAAAHHPVVVPLEGRAQQRRQQVHPGLGRAHVPLVEDG